jgi:hypothetical protein
MGTIEIPVLASPGLVVFYGALGFLLLYWAFKFVGSIFTGG